MDVATLAGVSLKTASRAMNGEPYVATGTRERVRAAAQTLDFSINNTASMLARGVGSKVVGLVIGDLTNPFYAALASGVESELRRHNLRLTLSSSDEAPDLERAIVSDLAKQHVTALIVVSTLDSHESYSSLQERGLPLVFVDRKPLGISADSVVFDNHEGSRMAAQRLLDLGHERIAFIGDYDRLPTYQQRLAGFAEAMDGAGVQGWRDLVRQGAHDVEAARRITLTLMAREAPTAIFASNNRAAIGAAQAITNLGASAPALIGFDDFDLATVLGITVVSHDPIEMGRRAAQLAVDAEPHPPQSIVLPTRLIERGSGERPPPPTGTA
jgi:LacI family transcriptional regulator